MVLTFEHLCKDQGYSPEVSDTCCPEWGAVSGWVWLLSKFDMKGHTYEGHV